MKAHPGLPPIGGWNLRDTGRLMPATDAQVLDNMIPRPGELQLRRGPTNWATHNTLVKSIFSYSPAGTGGRLFAATDAGLYNITTAGPFGSLQSVGTNGYWQHVNFATPATQFLCIVNGFDSYRHYNGTTWTTVATFTYNAGTITTAEFNHIASYKGRLFFLRKDERAFYYMETPATVSGTVRRFDMDAFFPAGGSIRAIATWTVDGGTGLDDYLVVISSAGEVVVFSGTDPVSATTWRYVGIYKLGRPLSARCFLKYAGDLLVLTEDGLFPLSRALLTGRTNRAVSVSAKIDPFFTLMTSLVGNEGWMMELHEKEALLLITVPSTPPVQLVMDLQSKGWCRFTGLVIQCLHSDGTNLFMGNSSGVDRMFTSLSDYLNPRYGAVKLAQSYFGDIGRLKQITDFRPVFRYSNNGELTLGISTEFSDQFEEFTQSFSIDTPGVWGTATWGSGLWASSELIYRDWNMAAHHPAFELSLSLRWASAFGDVHFYGVDYRTAGDVHR